MVASDMELSAKELKGNYYAAMEKGDFEVAASFANELGYLLKKECKWKEATYWFKQDCRLSCRLSREHDLPAALQSLGDMYLLQKKYEKAKKWMNAHLKLATVEFKLELEEQRASTQLGRLYTEMYEKSADCRDLIKAKTFAFRALELGKKLGRHLKKYEELARAYLNVGYLSLCSDDYVCAEEHLLEALQIYDNEELEVPDLNSEIHFNLSQLYRIKLEEAKAFKHINKDISICTLDKLPVELVKAYLEKGELHLFSLEKNYKNNLEAAAEAYKKGLEAAGKIEDDDLCQNCTVNLEVVEQARKDWERFNFLFARQNAFRRRSKTSGSEEKTEILKNCAGILFELGDLAFSLKAWKKMVEVYTILGEVAEELKRANLVIHSLLDVGLALTKLREFGKARQTYQNALEICETQSDLEGQCVAHIGLGSIDDHEGKFVESLQHYWRACDLAKKKRTKKLLQLQLEAAENTHYVYLVRLADEERVREAQKETEELRAQLAQEIDNSETPEEDVGGLGGGDVRPNSGFNSHSTYPSVGKEGEDRIMECDALEEMISRREAQRRIYRAETVGIGKVRNFLQKGVQGRPGETGTAQGSNLEEPCIMEESSDSEDEQTGDGETTMNTVNPVERAGYFPPSAGNESSENEDNTTENQMKEGEGQEEGPCTSSKELFDESESPKPTPRRQSRYMASRKRKVVPESDEEECELYEEAEKFKTEVQRTRVATARKPVDVRSRSPTISPEEQAMDSEENVQPFGTTVPGSTLLGDVQAPQVGRNMRKPETEVEAEVETQVFLGDYGVETSPASHGGQPSCSAAPPSKSTGVDFGLEKLESVLFKIEEQTFTVRFKRNNTTGLTVGWLADQCARVYFEHVSKGGRWPCLKLSFRGINLDSEQCLEDLFASMRRDDVLQAKVTKWSLEHKLPLRDLYVVSCHDINRKVHDGILNSIKTAGEVSVVDQALDEQEVEPLLRAIKRSCIAPTVLNLSHNSLGDPAILCISEVIEALKQETLSFNLNLHCNSLSLSALGLLADSNLAMMRLEVLDLSGNMLGDGGSRAFANLLTKATELRILALESCGIGERTISEISRVLLPTSPLMKFKLGWNMAVPDKIWEILMDKLLQLHSFKELDTSGMKIGKIGLKAVGKLLQSSQSFCALHIGWNSLMKGCTTTVVEMLSLPTNNLLSVDFSSCNIGNDSILSRLLHLDRLTTLKLSGNSLGPKSGEALGAVLGGNNCLLENLSLAGCSLGKSEIFAILESLSENKTLKILNLAANVSFPLRMSGSLTKCFQAGSAQQLEQTPQKYLFEKRLGEKHTPQKLFKGGLGNIHVPQNPRFEEGLGEKYIPQKPLFKEGLSPVSSDKRKDTSTQSSLNECDLDKFRERENSGIPTVDDSAETEIAEDSEEEDATTVEEGKSGEESNKTLFFWNPRQSRGLDGGKVSAIGLAELSRSIGILVHNQKVVTQQQIPLQGKPSSVISKLVVEKEDKEVATEHDSNGRARERTNIGTQSSKRNVESDERRESHGRQPETGTEFLHGVSCVLQRSTERIIGKETTWGVTCEECPLGDSCSLTSAKQRYSVESGRHIQLSSGNPGFFNDNKEENVGEIDGNSMTRLLSLVREAKGLLILDLSYNGLRQEDVRELQDSFSLTVDN